MVLRAFDESAASPADAVGPASAGDGGRSRPLSLEPDTENSVSPPQEWDASYCASPAAWLKVYCGVHGTLCWVPKRCGACDSCRELKAAEIRERARMGLERYARQHPGSWVGLLTLTSVPGTTWPEMVGAWSTFLRWLGRRRPGLLWLRVGETGADTGMRHWHVLMLGWTPVPQADLSAAWGRATGGRSYIVDIRGRRVAEGPSALSYVLKGVAYVTKALAERDHGGELNRPTQFSRGWPKPSDVRGERDCSWVVVDEVAGHVGPTSGFAGVSRGGCFVVREGREGCISWRAARLRDHLYLMRLPYELTRAGT